MISIYRSPIKLKVPIIWICLITYHLSIKCSTRYFYSFKCKKRLHGWSVNIKMIEIITISRVIYSSQEKQFICFYKFNFIVNTYSIRNNHLCKTFWKSIIKTISLSNQKDWCNKIIKIVWCSTAIILNCETFFFVKIMSNQRTKEKSLIITRIIRKSFWNSHTSKSFSPPIRIIKLIIYVVKIPNRFIFTIWNGILWKVCIRVKIFYICANCSLIYIAIDWRVSTGISLDVSNVHTFRNCRYWSLLSNNSSYRQITRFYRSIIYIVANISFIIITYYSTKPSWVSLRFTLFA